jgi:2-polyprenyl-3-methyl-5-hydroxy-6-metoxy-1,4-benzoquinol methylase
MTILGGTALLTRPSAIMLPNAAVNFTTSIAVSASPGFPPIVPLMPDILLINATETIFRGAKIQVSGVRGRTSDGQCVYICKKLTMREKEWYKDWFNSIYYHKLYFDRDETEAEGFISRLLQHMQPLPGSRMLDVACGRGRHSRFLASQGFDVSGIDISFDSIGYAKQYEGESLHFYQHDMRLPFWINYFDYAFNFFTSFGYFNTRREHDDAVRTVAQSLKPGGTLLFDYLNVHYIEDRLVPNETKIIDGTTYEIHRWQDANFFYKRITVNDKNLSNPIDHTEKVAKFSLGDFTEMLAYQRMQVQEVFGDYELNGYDVRKTPRLIVTAKRTS